MARDGRLIFRSADKAKQAIMASNQREIIKLYSDWAKEIGDKALYYSMKMNKSAWLQQMNMVQLQGQLTATSRQVSNEIYGLAKHSIYLTADAVVQANNKWLIGLGFPQDGVQAAFVHVPDEIVRRLVNGQIYEGGWNLSKAIWTNNEKTLKEIYGIVAKGRAMNMSAYEISKLLESYVSPGKRKLWNLTMKDGTKIYKKAVDYSAQRLVRTLTQHAYQQSFIATTEKNPFITDYIWHANGSRACPLCIDRDGQHYPKDELPMDHPNGMCTMEPNVDMNKTIDQLADWVNSPDGTFPEIDEFAKEFGYESAKKTAANILPDGFKDRAMTYVGGGYSGPSDVLSKDDINYIEHNMKETTAPLYRVEDARFTANKLDMDILDIDDFAFTDGLRSFTRGKDVIAYMLDEMSDGFAGIENPVVFETIGRTRHFNMDKYAESYFMDQKESLVSGKFQVVGDDYTTISGTFVRVIKIKQI